VIEKSLRFSKDGLEKNSSSTSRTSKSSLGSVLGYKIA
jgi:hypothetical protein